MGVEFDSSQHKYVDGYVYAGKLCEHISWTRTSEAGRMKLPPGLLEEALLAVETATIWIVSLVQLKHSFDTSTLKTLALNAQTY